jgi:hypothetical protein
MPVIVVAGQAEPAFQDRRGGADQAQPPLPPVPAVAHRLKQPAGRLCARDNRPIPRRLPVPGTRIPDRHTCEFPRPEARAVLQSNIVLGQNNDEVINLAITSSGTAWDLTGATVVVVVKPLASTPDGDPAAIHAEVTIVDPPNGLAVAAITADQLAAAGRWYWHADVIGGDGERKTALYGDVLIIPVAAAPVT